MGRAASGRPTSHTCRTIEIIRWAGTAALLTRCWAKRRQCVRRSRSGKRSCAQTGAPFVPPGWRSTRKRCAGRRPRCSRAASSSAAEAEAKAGAMTRAPSSPRRPARALPSLRWPTRSTTARPRELSLSGRPRRMSASLSCALAKCGGKVIRCTTCTPRRSRLATSSSTTPLLRGVSLGRTRARPPGPTQSTWMSPCCFRTVPRRWPPGSCAMQPKAASRAEARAWTFAARAPST